MNLDIISQRLPAMSDQAVAVVRAFDADLKRREQVPISTHHQIHGGIYTRTICLPKGAALTGVLIKIPTTLVLCGDVTVFTGTDEVRACGYAVFPGSAGRKQAFIANADTWMSMSFPTQATSVEEAENEFTDEPELLFSRRSTSDQTIITGE
jgi:hypothetical protein